MAAARTGNVDALKVLVEKGADVNAKETLRGTTPLMWAADEGHATAIQFLIEHGAAFFFGGRSGFPDEFQPLLERAPCVLL